MNYISIIKIMFFGLWQKCRDFIGLPSVSLEIFDSSYRTFKAETYVFDSLMKDGDLVVRGTGESQSKLLAMIKSIAEAFERRSFLKLRNSSEEKLIVTFSGWAAHSSFKQSEKAASDEILERDAGMVHWLTETPYLVINKESLPPEAKDKLNFNNERYHFSKILMSTQGFVPTISCLFQDQDGFGFMSHCFRDDPTQALFKSISEGLGLLGVAESKKIPSRFQEDACVAQMNCYAKDKPLPPWIEGASIDWSDSLRLFAEHLNRPKPSTIVSKTVEKFPLWITRSRSKDLQSHFWGSNQVALSEGFINFNRLGGSEISSQPHLVL